MKPYIHRTQRHLSSISRGCAHARRRLRFHALSSPGRRKGAFVGTRSRLRGGQASHGVGSSRQPALAGRHLTNFSTSETHQRLIESRNGRRRLPRGFPRRSRAAHERQSEAEKYFLGQGYTGTSRRNFVVDPWKEHMPLWSSPARDSCRSLSWTLTRPR